VDLYLVCFGKLKTQGLQTATDHYLKMLKKWANVKVIELKPISVPNKSPETRKQIQKKEAEKLKLTLSKYLSNKSKVFLLSETGRSQTTTEWAKKIETCQNQGVSQIAFCIGSSLGFDSSVYDLAQDSFNLGKQTLSHELARVVLAEQLFRAWSVTQSHPYHNEGC